MYRNKRIPRSNFILLEQKYKLFETVCVVIFFVIAKLVPPFSSFLSPQYKFGFSMIFTALKRTSQGEIDLRYVVRKVDILHSANSQFLIRFTKNSEGGRVLYSKKQPHFHENTSLLVARFDCSHVAQVFSHIVELCQSLICLLRFQLPKKCVKWQDFLLWSLHIKAPRLLLQRPQASCTYSCAIFARCLSRYSACADKCCDCGHANEKSGWGFRGLRQSRELPRGSPRLSLWM